jgi:4-hydroxy-tetrahydrodipicolinate reductase
MKIALLGYGRMGKEIEKIALSRGHQIVAKIDKDTSLEGLEAADVAINFSVPSAAVTNISQALHLSIPVVCGTTGWLDKLEEVNALCLQQNSAFLYASNFSLGVNLFFELNKNLARLMNHQSQYNPRIDEIHHTQKLDAPSGTAITLAEGLIENSQYEGWLLDSNKENQVKITAQRIDDVPGTHTGFYESEIDTLEIKHTAHNRSGFALGAVVAAEWIVGKHGIFGMNDVLNIG